jgi:RNA polymerase sigma factor (sigma-70 family)
MDYNTLTDIQLLRRCIGGDPEAGDFFVSAYSNLIYGSIHETVRRYAADCLREDIEDLHNSIFVALFKDDCRKLKQYRGDNDCSVASWLTVVAVNMTRNFLTRSRVNVSLDDDSVKSTILRERVPDAKPLALEQLVDAEEVRVLRQMIEELKPEDKLMLKYRIEGLSSKEIGDVMHKSPNTVDSKISRVRKRLQEMLKSRNVMP